MKSFKHPTIEIAIGKGVGHDHLCFRLEDKYIYTHIVHSNLRRKVELTFHDTDSKCDSEGELQWMEITDSICVHVQKF